MTTSNQSTLPNAKPFVQHILLADDDEDDCHLFKDALDELLVYGKFSCVNNGEKLMNLLTDGELLPDFIFLVFFLNCKICENNT